jgi:hypothetical protein
MSNILNITPEKLSKGNHMKILNIRLYFTLICLLSSFVLYSQDYSNKGTDFWLGYGYHVSMFNNNTTGGSQEMILYLTSDKNAKVTVEIPAVGY